MRKEESKSKQDEVSVEELQADLIRLQRQFRLLEDDRSSYKEESEHTLQKQNDIIKNLKDEFDDLSKDFKLAGSSKNKNMDLENTEKLSNLLAEEKVTLETMVEENKEIDLVDSKIKVLLEKTDNLRKTMGGCKASERRCVEMIKLNRVMEGRLHESSVKFNKALAKNSEMRQEIDHINKQKTRFKDLHKKLTQLFQAGKEEKDFLIESATTLFNSRDEAQHRMQSLRERSERDMTQFNSELKDLLRVIDHEKKLREFMNTKSEERGEMYEAAIQGRKQKKLMNYVKGLQVELEHYDKIFKELVEVSGLLNINEMVNSFIRIEDINFASFNFVKEQNQQIQKLENEIKEFKEDIKNIGNNDVVITTKHNEILKELKSKEGHFNNIMENINTMLTRDSKKLEKIREKVDHVFTKSRCNRSVMTELLGGSKIKNDNILSYLGLIEQKASELTQARALIALKNGGEFPEETVAQKAKMSFATVGQIARVLVAPPSINADIPEVNTPGEAVRPMSQQEAKMAAVKLVQTQVKTPLTKPAM